MKFFLALEHTILKSILVVGLLKMKIICTIGPSSNKPEILEKLKDRGATFFRINLSHTEEKDIEDRIKDLLGYNVPLILDTEGSQIRTGNTSEIEFPEGQIVKIHAKEGICDSSNLFFKPLEIVPKLNEGDLISLEFSSVLLKVTENYNQYKSEVVCKTLIGGTVGGQKAVQIESPTFNLPPFSKKDYLAIVLAKKYGIKHFTLSFMESPDSVIEFRRLYPESIIYSKIESKKGLDHFMEIAKVSEGILLDRGDLGSQVPLEKIPFIQKLIFKKVSELGKEAFVATNTLEQMAFTLKPNKAEVNDIINTILDGATGIALTKETAIGKYPVETLNMALNLISQVEFIKKGGGEILENIEKENYIHSDETPGLLVPPQGGKLIERYSPNYKGLLPEKSINITIDNLMDLEQIAFGAFSPLEGFIGSKDFHSVVDNYRLTNGVVWPIPITLSVNEDQRENLKEGEMISLKYEGDIYALLHLEEIYTISKEEEAQKIFGTVNLDHPGVNMFLNSGNYFLGGKIILLKKRKSKHKIHELTPKHTRKIFSERGWSKVIGFHTRNVPHKVHEFLQLEGLRESKCDGLFIHPIIGKKKKGDFEADVIIEAYEKMIENFYSNSKVVVGTLATYSRYGGPREALFTALIRKNFGCSHLIIGRDHTGVGNFYSPTASQEIFKNFSEEEIGITPIIFDNVFYSKLKNKYLQERDSFGHPEEEKFHISGSQARKMLLEGIQPPEWFMEPEISKIILERMNNGKKVFVD